MTNINREGCWTPIDVVPRTAAPVVSQTEIPSRRPRLRLRGECMDADAPTLAMPLPRARMDGRRHD